MSASSGPSALSDPALALLEFESVSAGIVSGDAMVKTSPISTIYDGTVHPGKYLVMVSGDTASVEVALETGLETAGDAVADSVFLPDIHPDVAKAVVGGPRKMTGEALAIVETSTVAATINAADAALKAAEVTLSTVRMADGLGGKGYLLISGQVAEVEAAQDAAVMRATEHGTLLRSDLIAQLHEDMAANLTTSSGFMKRIGG